MGPRIGRTTVRLLTKARSIENTTNITTKPIMHVIMLAKPLTGVTTDGAESLGVRLVVVFGAGATGAVFVVLRGAGSAMPGFRTVCGNVVWVRTCWP